MRAAATNRSRQSSQAFAVVGVALADEVGEVAGELEVAGVAEGAGAGEHGARRDGDSSRAMSCEWAGRMSAGSPLYQPP